MPPWVVDAPQMRMGLELFLDAFLDLSSCRATGWAEGRIPWTAMMDYCQAHEITGEQRDDLFHHVTALDVVYLKHVSAKREKLGGNSTRICPTHKDPR